MAIASVGGALRVFVANEGDGTVSVIDPGSRQPLATVTVGGQPTALDATPDGSRVVVLTHDPAGAGKAALIDARSNQRLAEIEVARDLTDLVASRDGASVFVVATDPSRNLYRIDLATNQVTERHLVAGGAGATAVTLGTAPGRLLITSVDGKLTSFDVGTGQPSSQVDVGRGPVDVAIGGPGVLGPSPSPAPAVEEPAVQPTLPRAAPSPSPSR